MRARHWFGLATALSSALTAAACFEDPGAAQCPEGEYGCQCLGNGTCIEGLVCMDNECITVLDDDDVGESSSSDGSSSEESSDEATATSDEATEDTSTDTGECDGVPRYVFQTEETYNGMLGGAAGADARCEAAAGEASLPGEWMAWVSDDVTSPAQRFSRCGPWQLVEGTIVAEDWDDLVDGTLDALITTSQHGGLVDDGGGVWTYTSWNGEPSSIPDDCAHWTTADENIGAVIGSPDDPDFGAWTEWTTAGSFPCVNEFHLYCFQQ